ncbi:MAG: stage II sporulation protein P [Oscillospiraceae bacterium]|nr:stage II sporulation protein P [Oscillospiraceae bacterium]
MKSNEKYPAELRIYHAEPTGEQPREKRKRGGSALFCAAGIFLLALWSYPEEIAFPAADAVKKGACELSRFSAGIEGLTWGDMGELFHSENNETDIIPNNSQVTANTIIDAKRISEEDALMLSRGSRHMPSSVNEETLVEDFLPPPEDIADPLPYPDSFSPTGTITPLSYEKGSGDNYIDLPEGGQLRNVTKLSSNLLYSEAILQPDFKIKLNAPEDEPQVLIMHTHTTESYQPDESTGYDPDYICRTTDSSKNMTAVGAAMANVFEKRGIRTYHDTTVHDYPSYNGSYDRSRETVRALLEKYPSIKVVLDVHRDAIERESGEIIAPTVTINGKSCAQVMMICGCDDGTMGMPNCMKNLRTASLFEQSMESRYNGLTRPVLYDYRKYNQDLTTGSLLIEVGGHGNSLSEAIYAGELSAEGIADGLISLGE